MKQLAALDLVAPGVWGLNTEEKNQVLPPQYCTSVTNLRVREGKLLAVRKGYTDSTTTNITSNPNIETLHEYYKADGTSEMIVAWDGGIGSGITDPEGNDISGSVTDTSGTWYMQNFNDKCVAFQAGQKLIVYTGTGNFATVVEGSGTAPTGGVGCAAFGRIWQVASDGSTINYCGLLDETDWAGTTSGTIDMNNIWTEGQDTITGLTGFNGALVIFGRRHVVFFSDAAGSALGLNPTNAYIQDVIGGTGCVDQHSIQKVGEDDIYFLSDQGVQSLGRLIQERSSPISTLTEKVRKELQADVRAHTAGTIRSTYNEDEGIYILTFANLNTYVLETKYAYPDQATGAKLNPVFKWDLAPWSWSSKRDGTLLMGNAGEVGTYGGTTDDGAKISFTYTSPWLEFGEELNNRVKVLKRVGLVFATIWGGSLVMKWAVDFEGEFRSKIIEIEETQSISEWGTAEWGTGEWGGTASLRILKTPARQSGQYYKLVLSASVDQAFELQQIELFTKMGRLA